jgi:hypothetical protein
VGGGKGKGARQNRKESKEMLTKDGERFNLMQSNGSKWEECADKNGRTKRIIDGPEAESEDGRAEDKLCGNERKVCMLSTSLASVHFYSLSLSSRSPL